jgi:hypothetical protein
VGLRNTRKHWGPISAKKAELRPECEALLKKVEAIVDAFDPPLLMSRVSE